MAAYICFSFSFLSCAADNKTVSLALAHDDELNFQLFRLDVSGALLFQQYINASWQPSAETVALAVAPKQNSPLAAISWSPSASDGDTQVRLYYLDGNNIINEFAGACRRTACTWKAGNSIIGGPTSPSSGLAAALIGSPGKPDGLIRVFYVGADSVLSETAYAGGQGWANGTTIGPKVSPDSSLAASVEPSSASFQVYYHAAEADGALAHASFDNSTQAWSTGTTIRALPSAPAPPSLAAVCLSGIRSHRVYFINSARQIEAYTSTNNGVTWSNLPQTADLSPLADEVGAPIVAASWATKVRIMYNTGGQIKEMSMKGTGQFYLMGEYGIHAATASGNTGNPQGKTNNGNATAPVDDGGTTRTDGSGYAGTNNSTYGKKEDDKKSEEQEGGWIRGDIITISTALPVGVFTIAGIVWKWKWLQNMWALYRMRSRLTEFLFAFFWSEHGNG
ncbi:hypothetical protein B0T14DRAFT_498032 [Immersiella caudata]|uniref:Fucose-specific lectin n=1 Tax=Immersiella caudata TaxID=314043 RepID=A0AA40BX70_9PEZI|nr:hypothetical protein B0T14DRAFT_498032 [Immersiella caudata]